MHCDSNCERGFEEAQGALLFKAISQLTIHHADTPAAWRTTSPCWGPFMPGHASEAFYTQFVMHPRCGPHATVLSELASSTTLCTRGPFQARFTLWTHRAIRLLKSAA